jgi:nucleoside-diphosphate-sugar epimerase
MRHVITGGSGFTGSALTYQLLERAGEVVNIDLKSPADPVLASSTRFICGDIRKPDDLARLELGCDDVVYHLAARQFADAVPHRGRDAWFSETHKVGRSLTRSER